MFLSNRHSFTIVRKKSDFNVAQNTETQHEQNISDGERRNFLKFLGGASAGALVLSMFPSKAQALIIGSSPTAGIVGVKNSSNVGVNPATEDGNLAILAGKDFATEATLTTLATETTLATKASEATLATRASETTLAAIKTNSDKFLFDVDGNLLTASSGGSASAVQLKDVSGTTINPSSEESILYLRRMVKLMESQAVVDNQMRQRVVVDLMPTTTVTGTITANIGTGTLAAVSTVTTLNQIAGVDSRWQIIDWSRQAYNSGIRGNLLNS
jgi:hypothetical protein